MPPLALAVAFCTGHDCFPPRPSVSPGSVTVRVNGRGVLCVGDQFAPHNCGNNTHSGVIIEGSSTIMIEGRKAARVGDMISCGSAVAMGSGNVTSDGG